MFVLLFFFKLNICLMSSFVYMVYIFRNKKSTHLRKLNCGGEIVCYRGRQISELRISPGSVRTTYFCSAQAVCRAAELMILSQCSPLALYSCHLEISGLRIQFERWRGNGFQMKAGHCQVMCQNRTNLGDRRGWSNTIWCLIG